jgi:hypothetical protein
MGPGVFPRALAKVSRALAKVPRALAKKGYA